MRIRTTCLFCSHRPDGVTGIGPHKDYWVDLSDDGAYIGKCELGHEIRWVVQNLRHEVLYQSGINALLSGFNREAVASIAAALERFFEFASYVMLHIRNASPEQVELAWKDVSDQSERQLGAFLMLHLAGLSKPFAMPAGAGKLSDLSAFRNRVVHKGRLPTFEESLKYARTVYEIVVAVGNDLIAHDQDAYQQVALRLGAFQAHRALDKRAPEPQLGPDGLYYGSSSTAWQMMLSRQPAGSHDFERDLDKARYMATYFGVTPIK